MNFLLFLAPFSWGTQKREAAAPKASGRFTGGTCDVREEPGKQKPRSCRAQGLARSRAQENVRRKKEQSIESGRIVRGVKEPTELPMRGGTLGVERCRAEESVGLTINL